MNVVIKTNNLHIKNYKIVNRLFCQIQCKFDLIYQAKGVKGEPFQRMKRRSNRITEYRRQMRRLFQDRKNLYFLNIAYNIVQ